MKKRAMKKWIPKHTVYCNDCKWRKYLGVYELNETNCEYIEKCILKYGKCTICKTSIFKCKYLNIIDKTEETLLWDGCKECDVSTE